MTIADTYNIGPVYCNPPGGGGGGGGSLQQAYAFLPSGSIALSLAGGPLAITNPIATAQTALKVTQNTGGQLAADFTGDVKITGKLTVTGILDPTALLLSDPALGTALYFDSANGQTAPVSGANHGRFRYNMPSQTWQMSMNGAAYVDIGTGSGSQATFVFRPGGATAGNVYATWAALYAAISAVSGTRFLLFDDSLVQPCPIPAGGPYNLADVIALGQSSPGAGLTEVKFLDNALVSEFFVKSYGLLFSTAATTVATCTLGAGTHIVDLEACNLTTALGATKPFFAVAGAGAVLALSLHQASIQTGVTESIKTTGTGSTSISLYDSSTLEASTLADDGASTTSITSDASCTVSQTQPATTPAVVTWAFSDAATRVLHNQAARDPSLVATPTFYVRIGGDDTHTGLSPTTAFATVARAIQAFPTMGEYATSFPYIDVGPGSFTMPYDVTLGVITVQGAPRTVANTYAVDATTPANSKSTGSRFVLNTLALAATVPIGTIVNFPATTTPGTANVGGRVYKADNSGAGGKLVIWVTPTLNQDPFVVQVAVAANVEIMTQTSTILVFEDFSSINNGFFVDCSLRSVGISSTVALNGADFIYCDFEIYGLVGGLGYTSTMPHHKDYLQSLRAAGVTLYKGGIVQTGGIVDEPGSFESFLGEIVFLDLADAIEKVGGGIATWYAGGAANFVTRLVDVTGHALVVALSGTTGVGGGGSYFLGDVLEARDIAGVVVDPFTGTFLVDVGADQAAQVKLGAASNVVVGLVTNPVAIGGVAKSSDISGTRISGGSPTPAQAGPAYRESAVNTAYDAKTDQTLGMDSTGGNVTATLPAANSVTPGYVARIKKLVTANNVSVALTGADTIDKVAATLSYSAFFGAGTQPSVDFESDGISNWMKV